MVAKVVDGVSAVEWPKRKPTCCGRNNIERWQSEKEIVAKLWPLSKFKGLEALCCEFPFEG